MTGAGPEQMLVAGGGIGGLAAALAIRAAGLDVVVLEREGDHREVGAGLSLWPNAMGVLDRLGVGADVRERAVRAPDTALCRPDGRLLARFPGRSGVAALGDALYIVHRAELLAVLAAAVGADCVRSCTPVVHVEAHDDGTAAVVTDGGSTMRCAGVVGADGVSSLVARWMHPEVVPRYAGWTAWRGVAAFAPGDMPGPPYAETWGSGGRRFGALPLRGDRIYWYATANRPEGEPAIGAAAEHAALVRDLGGWHQPVTAVLASTDPGSVLRNDVYDRADLPTWARAAVCLLGDAAHPMQPNLGQGACQALEDADVLGACLAAETSVAAAFARYEAVRKSHAERVVALSRRVGRVAQYGGAFRSLRDLGLHLTPPSLTIRGMKRFAARTTGPRGL